jgi:hypothetical protein
MRDFQDLKRSQYGDDPLSKEIVLFRKKREQADMIEQIFRSIKQNYNNTDINQMKTNIDAILSNPNMIYKANKAATYFTNLKNDFSAKAFNSPEISQRQIIQDFVVPEVQKKSSPPVPLDQSKPKSYQTSGSDFDQVQIVDQKKQPSLSKPQEARVQYSEPIATTQHSQPNSAFQTSQLRQTPVAENRLSEREADLPTKHVSPLKLARQPDAKVSQDKTEIHVGYKIKAPELTNTNNFNMGSTPISCIRALDTKNLAVGFDNGGFKLLDLTNPSQPTKALKFPSAIRTIEPILDIQGNATALLFGLGSPENSILHLDLKALDNKVSKYEGHSDQISQIALIGNNDFISSSFDGKLSYWTFGTYKPLKQVTAHIGKVNSIATLNSNQTLLSGGEDGVVRVYKLSNRDFILKNSLKEAGPVKSVNSFLGNSKFGFTTQQNGTIRIWNVEDGE